LAWRIFGFRSIATSIFTTRLDRVNSDFTTTKLNALLSIPLASLTLNPQHPPPPNMSNNAIAPEVKAAKKKKSKALDTNPIPDTASHSSDPAATGANATNGDHSSESPYIKEITK
jgi:hypothetical protein